MAKSNSDLYLVMEGTCKMLFMEQYTVFMEQFRKFKFHLKLKDIIDYNL